MDGVRLGRLLRMCRLRRGWRQLDVAARAGLAPAVIGRHENGVIGSHRSLERHSGAFGLRMEVRLVGRGGELARLADEEHAAIENAIAAWLRGHGFAVEAELGYSEWGERGRVDLAAWDAGSATLLIVEVKSQLTDLQELLGAVDAKERLAPAIGARRGWAVRRRVTLLAVAATAANRRIVTEHPALFAGWSVHRLSAAALRDGGRVLCWIRPQRAARRAWIAGRQRVSARR